jgi:anti-sigma B factor antagonist
MAIDIERERHGNVLVLAPRGRLDNDGAGDFELAVQQVLATGGRHLILDLSGLDYVSNRGLRMLVRLAKSFDTPTTSLRFAGASPAVRAMFGEAGVDALLQVHASRVSALADHPAARTGQLATQAGRILGAAAPPLGQEPDEASLRLAEQAAELLWGEGRETRAARAMVKGTQVMQSFVPERRKADAPPRVSFWRRLFGRRQSPR